MNKNDLVFMIEMDNNTKFGGYISKTIDNHSIIRMMYSARNPITIFKKISVWIY